MSNHSDNKINLPKSENSELIIDYKGITQLIPHRYPFLFVDGVCEYEKEKSIKGIKNFTYNEEFFQGHFPQEPVVPGVIQIEALAQISCILVALSFDVEGKRPAFTSIDGAKFKKPVRPGDTLILTATLERYRRGFAVFNTKALLRGEVATEAVIKAAMI